MTVETRETQTGINPNIHNNIAKIFSDDEQKIINIFAREWYITREGRHTIVRTDFQYILLKPVRNIIDVFNITKEVIVVFSAFKEIQSRSLEVFKLLVEYFGEKRVEKLCYILVSADDNVESFIKEYVTPDSEVIIPISYKEILRNNSDPHYIRNKLRNHFYSRDLFDISSPLKEDYFFFGRDDLVVSLVQKHLMHENTSLFGLRKTGKTSIIFGVLRKLKQKKSFGVMIDCQNTDFNLRRWNEALCYIINEAYKESVGENKIPFKVDEKEFTITSSTERFEYHIKEINKKTNKTIMFLFDEIENITYQKSASEHWRNDVDFIYFWQSIRSAYQRIGNLFTFAILGTNPKCIEMPTIQGKDNPIFNFFQPNYIPGFDVKYTREMVRKLGRLMGITFDETIYSDLTRDYGGHPFLIRHLCSKISKMNIDRPVKVDRIKYERAKEEFDKSKTDYYAMILEVLKDFYLDEYEMLKFLSLGQIDEFKFFASADSCFVNHLIGYGIISEENDGEYDFKIDSIRKYINRKESICFKKGNTIDNWKEICELRNVIETDLRVMVKSILRIVFKGESLAKAYVVKKIFSNIEQNYYSHSYNDLFNAKKSLISFFNLKDLINYNWDYFKDYFMISRDIFINSMNVINNEGRYDAHAKEPDQDEMILIRAAISKIQSGIDSFKES